MRDVLHRFRLVPFLLLLGVLALVPAAGPAAAEPVPVVAPGDPVVVRLGGFAPGGRVVVQLVHSTSGRFTVRAGADGRVHTRFRAPTAPGRYRALVSGPSRSTSRPPAPMASGAGDLQVISVTVPLVVGVPFQVGGSGIASAGGHVGQGPSGAGTAGLAITGIDLRRPLVLGALLVLLG